MILKCILQTADKIFLKYIPILGYSCKPDSWEFWQKENMRKSAHDNAIWWFLSWKPSKAIHFALTWSDYKIENTIKYFLNISYPTDGIFQTERL